jgi:hypothetical protein
MAKNRVYAFDQTQKCVQTQKITLKKFILPFSSHERKNFCSIYIKINSHPAAFARKTNTVQKVVFDFSLPEGGAGRFA